MPARNIVKNARYGTKELMGRYKFLYELLPFVKREPWLKVSPTDSICIEGFPRSANSFFVAAFCLNNPAAKCAHHMHVPMQIVKAAEYGVPCIALIRNPVDAIASVLVVDRSLSMRLAVQSYINFYERIWPVRRAITIADFKQATQHPHKVVEAVNRRYGTSFKMPPLESSTRETIFEGLREAQKKLDLPETLVAVPTPMKAQVKQAILPALQKHPLLPKANTLYQQFIDV